MEHKSVFNAAIVYCVIFCACSVTVLCYEAMLVFYYVLRTTAGNQLSAKSDSYIFIK